MLVHAAWALWGLNLILLALVAVDTYRSPRSTFDLRDLIYLILGFAVVLSGAIAFLIPWLQARGSTGRLALLCVLLLPLPLLGLFRLMARAERSVAAARLDAATGHFADAHVEAVAQAIREQNRPVLEEKLKQPIDWHALDGRGYDLIGYALELFVAGTIQSPTVERLFAAGADLRGSRPPYRLGWVYQVQSCGRENADKVLRLILQHGADPHETSQYQNTPLHDVLPHYAWAVPVLVQGGANLEAKNEQDHTPLSYAARYERWAVVMELLKAGANPQPQANPEGNLRRCVRKSRAMYTNLGSLAQEDPELKNVEAWLARHGRGGN
jgi:hypothetical protein